MTLFGVIDEGLTYMSNLASNAGGPNQWAMASGMRQGSRWGLRGAEDLGDGTKAIFLFESDFDASNGKLTQGGLEFGRRVYVGLSDKRLGTVTMGRQYDMVVDYPGVYSDRAFGGGYVASHPCDIRQPQQRLPHQQLDQVRKPELVGLPLRQHVWLGRRPRDD